MQCLANPLIAAGFGHREMAHEDMEAVAKDIAEAISSRG